MRRGVGNDFREASGLSFLETVEKSRINQQIVVSEKAGQAVARLHTRGHLPLARVPLGNTQTRHISRE